MMRAGELDYALARIAARFGERSDDVAWRSIAVIRDFASMVDAVRDGPLHRWTAGLASDADARAIEAVLRTNWRALVDEVCSWMPSEWQPSVAWAGTLVELPLGAHDDVDPATAIAAWRREWWRRAPRAARRDETLRTLGRLLARHRTVRVEPRRALCLRLEALYRRATLDPGAAFVFLALSALDLERLRGELVVRALFPAVGGGESDKARRDEKVAA
jgi:hypothetical protein